MMKLSAEALAMSVRHPSWEAATNVLPDLSDSEIEKRLLHGDPTAQEIWREAVPLLDGDSRAQKFWSHVPITPLLHIPREALPEDVRNSGSEVYFIPDGMMPTGAYKFGGGMNALLSELEQRQDLREVHVASTGNHAAAAALASVLLGLECTVYMPESAVAAKVENVAQYGAHIEYLPTLREAVAMARMGGDGEQSVFIHPYDQASVIAGQGSATVRLMRGLKAHGIDPGMAQVTYPVGGGGNAAGNAVVGAVLLPGIHTNVAEVEGCDPAVDGAAVAFEDRGARGQSILSSGHFVRASRSVSLGQVGEAMAVIARITEVYEPAGAVALAAVLQDIGERPDRRIHIAHGSGINTTPAKVTEFARYAYEARRLDGKAAHELVSAAGVDRRRRLPIEERAVETARRRLAGELAITSGLRIASGAMAYR